MEKANEHINGWQLVALLTISQLYWLLGWPRRLENGLLLSAAVILTTMLMALYLAVGGTGFDAARLIANPVGGGFVWIFCLFTCVRVTFQFMTEFSLLFEQQFAPLMVLAVLLLAVGAVAAMGQNALLRAAFLLVPFILLSFLLLTLGAADQCSVLNLTLPEENAYALPKLVIGVFCDQPELILFILLRPKTKRPPRHLPSVWLLIALGCEELLMILASLTLGAYGSLGAYPYYVFTRVADLSSASRLTPVYWFLLVSSLLVRLSIFFLMAESIGKKVLPDHIKRIWAQIGLLLIGILIVYYSSVKAETLTTISGIGILLFSCMLLVFRKRRRQG